MHHFEELLPPALKRVWSFMGHADDVTFEREYDVTLRAPVGGTPVLKARERGFGHVEIVGKPAILDFQEAVNAAVEAIEE